MLPDFILEQLNEFYKGEITDDFLQEIYQNAQYLELEKGEILFSDKKTKSQNFLLLKGSAVRIIMTEMGQEKAVSFHTEHFLPFVGKIFLEEEKSDVSYFVKVNEPLKTLVISSDFVEKAIQKYPFFAQRIYASLLMYIRSLLSFRTIYWGLIAKNSFSGFGRNILLFFSGFSPKTLPR